jgi:hypothetical protein
MVSKRAASGGFRRVPRTMPAPFYAGHTLWHQPDAAGSIGAAGERRWAEQ